MKRLEEMIQASRSSSRPINCGARNHHGARKIKVSLQQWCILHAVHDCGSFVAAGEQVHLSQSAISYRIGKIEQQLGVAIYELDGRKASLTEAGKQILMKSRLLLEEAFELEDFAKRIASEHKRY